MPRSSIILVVAATVLAACDTESVSTGGNDVVKGSGVFKTETRAVEKFSAIRLDVVAHVTIERSGTDSVAVTADDNILPVLLTEVRDATLTLSSPKGKEFSSSKIPTFKITVSELRQIDLAGSGTVRASKLGGNALTLALSGSGTLSAAGDTDELTATLSGSGTLNAAQLKARRAKATLTGSGDLTVNADELEAVLSGSGTISYLGAPKLSQTVTGSGSIRKK
jgi:predicted small secreted protein